MPDNELVAFIFTLMAISVTIISVAKSWAKRAEFLRARPPAELPQSDERLARIENAIEAMAIEVERISEGQRYAAKLLTERTRDPAPTDGAPDTAR